MTTHKAAIYENDLKMSRKDFPLLMTKKEPRQDKYRGKDIVQSGCTPLGWQFTKKKKKIPQSFKSSPRLMVCALYWVTHPKGPTPGRWASRTSSFENQWCLCSGELDDSVKQRFHYQRIYRNITSSESWTIIRKGSLFADLKRASWRNRRQLGLLVTTGHR